MIKNDLHDIAKMLASKYGISVNEAKTFTNTFIDLVNEGLQEDGLVKIKGFGTFKIVEVKDRESINVTTGERILIPGRSKVTFTPDSVMKELVNKPFSQFDTVVLNEGVDFSDIDQQTEEITDTENIEESVIEPVAEESGVEAIETIVPIVPIVPIDPIDPIDPIVPIEAIDPIDSAEDPVADSFDTQDTPDEVPAMFIPQQQEEEDVVQEEIPVEDPVKIEQEETDKIQEPQDTKEEFTQISNNHKEEKEMSHRHSHGRRNTISWWIPLGFLLSLAIGILIGYHIGIRQIPAPPQVIDAEYADSIKDTTSVKKSNTVKKNPEKVNTVKEETVKQPDVAPQKEEAKPQPAKPTAESVVKPTVSANDSQTLRNAKQMVSKGAYNITGTQETITVKPGQTLKKISKFYLGDGMECYIQAYNNIEEVSEGMKLKIPQLKLKKK
ncbi:MAG: HU family DNA-binding protein [Prevotella sp.]|nr:HU family DNA-binding protein [Prevotella sp.]